MKTGRFFSLFAWLMLALCSAGLRAQTPAEPSVRQIYETAGSGDLHAAQKMIDQVIAAHPKSAKAHYVKAELSARERDGATARSELQAAERLAPGLPFARADAVSALRTQVDRLATDTSPPRAAQPRPDVRRMGAPPTQERGGGFPFGTILLAAVIALGVVLMLRRRRAATPSPAARAASMQQPWGYDGGAATPPVGRRGFDLDPPRRYDATTGGLRAAGPMGQPQQGSMGSSIMRGLGTGLAVGAGAVAAQEIGRRIFDHGRDPERAVQHDALSGLGAAGAADSQIARDAGLGAFSDPQVNHDFGGQDFGIADGGGWDDAGGGGDAGGGDWDN